MTPESAFHQSGSWLYVSKWYGATSAKPFRTRSPSYHRAASQSGTFMPTEAARVEALAFFAQLGIPLDERDIQHRVEVRRIHETAATRRDSTRYECATARNLDSMRAIPERAQAKIKRQMPINEEDRDSQLETVNAMQNTVFYRIVKIGRAPAPDGICVSKPRIRLLVWVVERKVILTH